MRLRTLRIRILNGYLFASEAGGHGNGCKYFSSQNDSYNEYEYDAETVRHLLSSHNNFKNWYFLKENISLIPKGRVGNELRFLIPNGYNSKRWK